MNLAKMMKQAQAMQANMLAKQEELAAREFTSSVGGGKVTATATGNGDVRSITIDPSVVDPSDVDFLQDLVLKAVQEAIAMGKDATAVEMKKLTGGLGIPGL
jgi:DNA-binding YbaB/EbfC family protein